mmetsp:Transcript_44519/g.115746  ORF Transcript_44519/g.115746 Transcript_44519/m.115746 type:complete len:135 (-) Transcript_44519:456-860(-)
MAKCWTGNDTAWASDQFRKFNQVTSGIEGQFNGSETCMSSSGSVAPSGYNPSGMFACWLTQMQREEGRRTNYVGRAIRERCGLFGEPECPGVDDEVGSAFYFLLGKGCSLCGFIHTRLYFCFSSDFACSRLLFG